MEQLENGATYGTQRAKINSNVIEAEERLSSLEGSITDVNLEIENKVDKDGDKVLTDVNFSVAKDAKLAGIATGATANQTDTYLLTRANGIGNQAASTITEDSTHRFSTDAEKAVWNAKQAALGFTPLPNNQEIPESLLPPKTADEITDFIWASIQVKLTEAGYVPGGTTPLAQSVITFGTSTSTSNIINWTDVTNAATQTLQYLNGVTWENLLTNTTLNTFTHTGLTESTSYDYRVISNPSSGYSQSISDIESKETAEELPDSILVPNFIFTNGSGGESAGEIVSYDADTQVVAANTIDTTTSSLFIKSFELRWNASWSFKNVTIGLGNTGLDFAIYIPFTLSIDTIVPSDTETGVYSLPAATSSRVRIRAIADGGFWRVFLETSTDSGATWTIRNSTTQGGSSGFLSAVASTTNLLGRIICSDAGTTIDEIKYTL